MDFKQQFYIPAPYRQVKLIIPASKMLDVDLLGMVSIVCNVIETIVMFFMSVISWIIEMLLYFVWDIWIVSITLFLQWIWSEFSYFRIQRAFITCFVIKIVSFDHILDIDWFYFFGKSTHWRSSLNSLIF